MHGHTHALVGSPFHSPYPPPFGAWPVYPPHGSPHYFAPHMPPGSPMYGMAPHLAGGMAPPPSPATGLETPEEKERAAEMQRAALQAQLQMQMQAQQALEAQLHMIKQSISALSPERAKELTPKKGHVWSNLLRHMSKYRRSKNVG